MDATTLQPLSRAVLADPAEPAPRLVLADAYADADDDARSAWMRRVADRLDGEDGYQWDHVRSWRDGDFRCEMFDTNRPHMGAQTIVAYELWHADELIFWGGDYGCSPLHAVDSDASLAALLSFLALRPGDTDADYFRTYSAEQLDWCRKWGEELGMIADDIEERGTDYVTLSRADRGLGYLLTHRDERDLLFQTDWDYPSLATSFGWSPAEAGAAGCGCNSTDGTIACPECGTQPTDYITSAADWLDAHEGETIADPGYFVEE